MNTDEAAVWLAKTNNQTKICKKIGNGSKFQAQTFNIIAFNIPLAIETNDNEHRLEICKANNLDPNTINSIRWVKSINRRSPNQLMAHLILTINNTSSANRAITNGLKICNKRCHIKKVKRELPRCMKCQGWNHFAKECTEQNDTCGNCTKSHRTNTCSNFHQKCVSCKSDDHPSWSQNCPTFIKKTEEFNERNLDNLLQFFPAADS